jgi:adenylosuccinate lyase
MDDIELSQAPVRAPAPAPAAALQPVPANNAIFNKLSVYAGRIDATLPAVYETITKMNLLAMQSKEQVMINKVHDYISQIQKKLEKMKPFFLHAGKKRRTHRLKHKRGLL